MSFLPSDTHTRRPRFASKPHIIPFIYYGVSVPRSLPPHSLSGRGVWSYRRYLVVASGPISIVIWLRCRRPGRLHQIVPRVSPRAPFICCYCCRCSDCCCAGSCVDELAWMSLFPSCSLHRGKSRVLLRVMNLLQFRGIRQLNTSWPKADSSTRLYDVRNDRV